VVRWGEDKTQSTGRGMVQSQCHYPEDVRIPLGSHNIHAGAVQRASVAGAQDSTFSVQNTTMAPESLRFRGLDLPNLYWVQLTQHLQSIFRHMHRDTPSKDLHVENMDLVQFHVGSTVNFWELPFKEYWSLALNGWMKHTWQALSLTTLTLRGPRWDCQMKGGWTCHSWMHLSREDTIPRPSLP
jgi:hypothetical protein